MVYHINEMCDIVKFEIKKDELLYNE